MRESGPATKTLKATEARQQWSELLNEVFRKETRIVVEKSGVVVAAIVSADDLARMVEMDRQRDERFRVLDRIGEAFKDVPAEDLEREVSKAIGDARASIRKEKKAKSNAVRRRASAL